MIDTAPISVHVAVLAMAILLGYVGYLLFGAAQGLTEAILRTPEWSWHLAWAAPLAGLCYLSGCLLMAVPLYTILRIIDASI